MIILVVNRTKNLYPDFPSACVIKLCRSPFEIPGIGTAEEKLVTNRTVEKQTVEHMLRRMNEEKYHEDTFRYFVQIDSDGVKGNNRIQIGLISPVGEILDAVITADTGELFGCKEGTKINLSQYSLSEESDFVKLHNMLEMAKLLSSVL